MFLKNKNISFKIRRSNVTDYAALRLVQIDQSFGGYFKHLVVSTMLLCRFYLSLSQLRDVGTHRIGICKQRVLGRVCSIAQSR